MSSPTLGEDNARLRRTRSAVWNILMLDGITIGISGLLLRQRAWGVAPIPLELAWKLSYYSLLGLIFASTMARLVSVTPWAARRSGRFFWTHVWSAAFGAMAVPLGFAFAWLIRPRLEAVGPFWAVALGLGLLALPRRDEAELIHNQRTTAPPEHDEWTG